MALNSISGFTFVHNAIDSGYPIIEAILAVKPFVNQIVVVDMQSTDRTRQALELIDNIKIVDGYWGNQAGETLRQAHSRYMDCDGDIIIHFEADEVFDESLIKYISQTARRGEITDMAVYRLQIEQNFQRCRWYPELVHRVWRRDSPTRKEGHTTNRHHLATKIPCDYGYLWDCTNCFRDNWFNRVKKQAELRNTEPQYIMTPLHTLQSSETSELRAMRSIHYHHWTHKRTPFNIPEILKPLLGMVKYEPR